MKTMRREKSQTMVKDTKPKEKYKGSIESGSKNHQNEVKWRQLKI